MKRILSGLMVGALSVTLFASQAVPSEWDPDRPPPTPYTTIHNHTGSGDDVPWIEPIQSGQDDGTEGGIRIFDLKSGCFNAIWIKFIFKGLIKDTIKPFSDENEANQFKTVEPNQGFTR